LLLEMRVRWRGSGRKKLPAADPPSKIAKVSPGLCEQITKLEPGEPSANDEVFHISLPI
jgi:hypothetical protein